MANTIQQIRRSISNSVVSGLSAGQLAFTANGYGVNTGALYIGNPNGTGVSVIGGTYNPGILSNNQALVANAVGSINQIIAANLTITSILANGSYGTTAQLLAVNSSAGVYWTTVSGSGTVTNITMGNGLTSTQSPLTTTGTMSVNLASTPGLNFSSGGLEVLSGPGIVVNSTGTCANLAASPGLTFSSGGLAVNPGSSIAVGATTTVNLAVNSGLSGSPGLSVAFGNGLTTNSTFLSVLGSSSFTVNAGGLYINTSGALSFSSLTLTGSPLPIGSGGTGCTTTTNCALLIGSGTTAYTTLAAGTDTNDFLTSNAGVVTWSNIIDSGTF